MANRKNEASWIDSRQRWQIKVQAEGVRRTFTSSTPGKKGKIEAERKADQWLENQLIGENTRCDTLLNRWLEHVKAATSTSNYQQNECNARRYIRPIIGHKKIGSLTENDLQRVIDMAYQHGLSRKSLKNLRGACTAFIKYCRKEKCTSFKPEEIRIPAGAKKSKKTILRPEAIKTLFSSSKTTWRGKVVEDWFIHAYRLAVLIGLRPGELLGLQWRDLRGNKLHVRRAYNDEGEITQGKNDNAVRVIVLGETAMAEVLAQKKKLLAAGISLYWMFPYMDAGVASQDTYRSFWRRYREHNGIPSISPYEMRHTFVSVCDEMPEALKKMIVGHSESMDTEGIYGHQKAGDLERAAGYADAAFKKIIAPDKAEK